MKTRISKLDNGLIALTQDDESDFMRFSADLDLNSLLQESQVIGLRHPVTGKWSKPESKNRSIAAKGETTAHQTSSKKRKITVKLIIEPRFLSDGSEFLQQGTQDIGKAIVTEVKKLNGSLVSIGPNVAIVELPVSNLSLIEELDWVISAEKPVRLRLSMMDARGAATNLDAALGSRPELNGEGVVLGVIDSGVDWRHPDFINPDGTSRIELFIHSTYDQTTDTHTHTEYTREHINRALEGQAEMPVGDRNGHGTHCASIAAGNGRANPDFRGVATHASIVAVRADVLYDTALINGIRRTFEIAGSRPAIVNMSLGGHSGAHDGTSAIENVISQESGPGRIVAVAAGNEGTDRIHDSIHLKTGESKDIHFTIRDELQWLNVWIPRGDDVSISIVDPDDTEIELTGEIQSTEAGDFQADLQQNPINLDNHLMLAVAAKQKNRIWRLRFRGSQVLSGRIHAWGLTRNSDEGYGIFMSARQLSHSVGVPATEERAISVGSYVARGTVLPGQDNTNALADGSLSNFSSRGPTRIGFQKPDICAPGQFIGAALAADSEMASADYLANRRFSNDQYISIQGTSMATPFIAGVVALLLQREPSLTPEQIKQRLRITAQRDGFTGGVWNKDFGHGKVDVQRLLDYLGP